MAFPKINELLVEVKAEFDSGNFSSMEECFNSYIRKRRYWPMVQVKKYFGNAGLVLLHNTYKRTDVEHFKELYEEARSVVLDLNAPVGENIVVCLADKIPERISTEEYKHLQNPEDECEECYEGTMVYVYHHNNKWFFSTSTCPSVDSSRYFHPTKTHGTMFNEALQQFFPDTPVEELRNRFTLYLNPEYSYGFLLVHHENRHVMDYSDFFEQENYAKLFHIFTREKATKEAVPHNLSELGIRYPLKFANIETALEELVRMPLYGILAKTEKGMYKISAPEVIKAEKENLGNSNPWINLLSVYMQQNPEFKINDYINKYCQDKKDSLNLVLESGEELPPVYIIHTTMMTLKLMLHSFYHTTTVYDSHSKRYHLDKELDEQFSPIIRFHLAQLRHIQITSHRHIPLTPQAVYHYLCLHQTMKNMRMLIHHVAKGNYNLSYKSEACFKHLAEVL